MVVAGTAETRSPFTLTLVTLGAVVFFEGGGP